MEYQPSSTAASFLLTACTDCDDEINRKLPPNATAAAWPRSTSMCEEQGIKPEASSHDSFSEHKTCRRPKVLPGAQGYIPVWQKGLCL